MDDILYIVKEDRNLVCHLVSGAAITSKTLRKSMKETLAPLLESERFAMGGASMLLNLTKITLITPEDVTFTGGEYLHIPARCYRELYEARSRL